MSNKISKSGFTLLFASLIGALVIAVGLAILDITLKQLLLASAGRESQQAFYSADAGTECALFLDRGAGFNDCRLGFFGTPSSTPSSMTICGVDSSSAPHVGAGSAADVQCFGKEISISRTIHGDTVENDFVLDTSLNADVPASTATNDDMCFSVAVLKIADTSSVVSASGTTIIESRGYNTCNPNAANRFERAIRTVNQ